jgi:hypothetical protein
VGKRARVIAKPFEQVEPPPVSFITCRALDKFVEKLPALIEWAPAGSTFLLFGGETLREQLKKAGMKVEELLIPQSEKRFLFLATD